MGSSPVTLVNGKPQILGSNGQPVPSASSAPTTSAPAPNPIAAPNYSRVSPTYLSQLFPNGIPQATASLSSTAPQASASTVSTQGLGPEAMVSQILGAEQPIFGQQNKALLNNLASAGIVGGSTAGAGNDLAMSQLQQSLAAIAPYEQTAQQTKLGANEFNSGVLNNNSQYNTSNLVNTNNLNAAIKNANSQFNTNNALNAGQIDANSANTILGQLLGFQNQDYITQLNNQEQLAQAQETGTNAAGAPVYQPAPSPTFGGLSGAFGTAAATGTPAAGGSAFGTTIRGTPSGTFSNPASALNA